MSISITVTLHKNVKSVVRLDVVNDMVRINHKENGDWVVAGHLKDFTAWWMLAKSDKHV